MGLRYGGGVGRVGSPASFLIHGMMPAVGDAARAVESVDSPSVDPAVSAADSGVESVESVESTVDPPVSVDIFERHLLTNLSHTIC